MNICKLAISLLAVGFGVFLFFFGGYDDSPGAQGLGVLIAAAGVRGVIRHRRKYSL